MLRMLNILSKIANRIKVPRFDAFLENLEQRNYIPVNTNVTVGDCLLACQMGYRVEVSNGRVRSIKKEKAPKRR